MKQFRNNGAVGALLDEYEKAITELLDVISDISSVQLVKIIDTNTEDEDCKSIQTRLTHVVSAGYNYVIIIRKWLGETIDYKDKVLLNSIDEYSISFNDMFLFNVKLFNNYPNIQLYETNSNKKIKTRWQQSYDVDQLFEHAILHVLRHRRQIERFKVQL